MEIKADLLKHPDIINPFNLGRDASKDRAFITDLSLESLLASVPFYSSDSRELTEAVLVDYECDMDTVHFRQAIFEELILNSDLRSNILSCIKKLDALEYKLDSFHNKPNLSNGLNLLRSYEDLVINLPDLDEAKSHGLQEVNSYFKDIKKSESHSKLRNLINHIDNAEGIDFRVYLDKDGVPVRMSALELADRKPGAKSKISLFQKIMRRAEEGHSLRHWGGDLNPVGKVVTEYLDKQFTPIIKSYIGQIAEITELLEPLDLYAGFAEYFIKLRQLDFDICRPSLFPLEERITEIIDARNPLLSGVITGGSQPSWLKGRGAGSKRVIPNDVSNRAENNMFIITGPNNGGKTTYVKTVGLIQLMSQKGLFVTAKSAKVSFVDGIYTHFVTPEDITKGEGRYKNELRRIKEIFERATPYSLVILDEPCGGTSHEEGERQSLALLDGFHRLSATTYFTTHMHRLTEEVDSGRYTAAKNLYVECTYDGKKVHYTYKVKKGAFGKSFGEEIARELGLMPEDIRDAVTRRATAEGYGEKLRQ